MSEQLSRILVVDDIERNRKTLIAALKQDAVEVIEASSGPEALEALDEHDPDLILLDVMMPGMDGFETTRRIRDSERWREVPIVLVTALDDEKSLIEGFDAGADDFISKPFSRVELRARVRSFLRLNRYRRLEDERMARVRASQLARQTELLYRELVERAQVLVQMMSADGDLLFANDVWLAELGYSEEDARSLNLSDVVHPSSMEHCHRVLSKVLSSEEPQFVEADLVSRDGRLIKVEGAVVSRVRGAGAESSLALLRNVTERAQLQEELAAAQRLEQVGRLTAGIAHDFGNILAVISMCLPAPPAEDEDRDWTIDMRAALGDGMELVSDLMGISRSAVLDPIEVNAAEQLAIAFDTVTRLLPSTVSVHRTIECPGASFQVHPPTLRRILLNLATNARDAMAGRGDLFLEAALAAGDEDTSPMLRIRVRDTGPGVSPETLKRLFDPFFTTKAEGVGTGLGLASVRGLVEQQGGKIWAANGASGGLQITMSFPTE